MLWIKKKRAGLRGARSADQELAAQAERAKRLFARSLLVTAKDELVKIEMLATEARKNEALGYAVVLMAARRCTLVAPPAASPESAAIAASVEDQLIRTIVCAAARVGIATDSVAEAVAQLAWAHQLGPVFDWIDGSAESLFYG